MPNVAMVSLIYRKAQTEVVLTRDLLYLGLHWPCHNSMFPSAILTLAGKGKPQMNISPIIVYFTGRRVIPCIRLKLYLQPAVALWSFPAKLVVPCICASPSISDKGLRCDWAIQQENNSESIQITSELLVLVLLNSYSRDSKCTYAPH